MSITDDVDDLEGAVRYALAKAKALRFARFIPR
jgi:hypothetical protein